MEAEDHKMDKNRIENLIHLQLIMYDMATDNQSQA